MCYYIVILEVDSIMIFQSAQEHIELLIDGGETFSRVIQRTKSAKSSIYINMYIWRDDKVGNRIAQELINAAGRGVKIYISKDALGAIFEKAEEDKQSFFHKEPKFSLWARRKMMDLFYHVLLHLCRV